MLSNKAPKARNVIAQGNALGLEPASWPSAEGAKYKVSATAFRSLGVIRSISRRWRSKSHVASAWAVGPGYYISRRWRSSLMTAMLFASLLSATAMGQKKYERPPIKAPDEFRGAESNTSPDPNSIGDLKWFEVFQDEELQKLVRTAMVQNYDLRGAR
jgi:hypothetical protein